MNNPIESESACDLAIIGAGAAGLMAAIFAGRSAKPGTKIVLIDVTTADYFGGTSNNTVNKVLKSFSVEETTAFFRELGVELKREETGKLFPTTDSSRTVLDALLKAVREAGVELRTGCRVLKIERDADQSTFKIAIDGTLPLYARRVILATGGKALPDTGSDGVGYNFARALGHSVTETWPALVPLNLQPDHWLTQLAGITLDVELTLSGKTGKALHKQAGPMLLAHFGITGPAAMDISRHLRDYASEAPRKLTANLRPGMTFDEVDQSLLEASREHPTRSIGALLKRKLPERFVELMLLKQLAIEPGLPLSQLNKEDRKALSHLITALHLPVVGDRGFKYAEVTAGGVPVSEVQTATMASRQCPGLYLCGEILDVDGRIGGYNFQWAWCTGRLAGLGAAQSPTTPVH